MADQKVATEVAEQEFARWAEAMDLDFEPRGWTDDDKQAFTNRKNRLVRAIEKGHLVVDTEGRMVFTPQASPERDPITFNEPKGATLMAMDKKKAGAQHEKEYSVLAEMSGENAIRFANMQLRDLKICDAILSLFLGA